MTIHSMGGCSCHNKTLAIDPKVRELYLDEIRESGHLYDCDYHPASADKSYRYYMHNENLKRSRLFNCRNCVGQGRFALLEGHDHRCPMCRGAGRVYRHKRDEQPWQPANRIFAHQSTAWRKWSMDKGDLMTEAAIKHTRRHGTPEEKDEAWTTHLQVLGYVQQVETS